MHAFVFPDCPPTPTNKKEKKRDVGGVVQCLCNDLHMSNWVCSGGERAVYLKAFFWSDMVKYLKKRSWIKLKESLQSIMWLKYKKKNLQAVKTPAPQGPRRLFSFYILHTFHESDFKVEQSGARRFIFLPCLQILSRNPPPLFVYSSSEHFTSLPDIFATIKPPTHGADGSWLVPSRN